MVQEKKKLEMPVKSVVAIIACVITLLTCGASVGFVGGRIHEVRCNIEKSEEKLHEVLQTTHTDIKENKESISEIQRKFAYLEGVVTTKLNNIESKVTTIERKLNDWEPADEKGTK